jgi:hypothetical protein
VPSLQQSEHEHVGVEHRLGSQLQSLQVLLLLLLQLESHAKSAQQLLPASSQHTPLQSSHAGGGEVQLAGSGSQSVPGQHWSPPPTSEQHTPTHGMQAMRPLPLPLPDALRKDTALPQAPIARPRKLTTAAWATTRRRPMACMKACVFMVNA